MPAIIEPVAVWFAQTVGSAVGAAATAVGVPASVALPVAATAANIAYVAAYAGSAYAVDAISRPKFKPPGSELTLNIDPAYPREMIIGERLVGGSMVARYSRGSNLYNAHLVIQLADHPCVELSKVYDGGRLVQSSALAHGVRTEITAYSYSGGPRVWMTWHDGRPGQTVDSDLVTKSAQDPEVVAGKIDGWTNNHRGAGCAYVHVEVQWDQDILTQLPQFTFLVKGAKLYDRRKDTTAGGSGSHRLNDPSTWEYSTNAMVALDHYLLGYQVEDDDLAFGVGLSPIEVPYAQFEAAADLCDEDVVTGTGGATETIKRYVVNAVISAGEEFESVIESFQLQMAARVVDLGGRIGILGAEERAITVALDEGDLVADEPLQFADKLQFADLYGSVSGTFADPANLYQPTAYETQTSAYALLPDGGEAQAVSLPLPYEVHPRRAVRLASAWLARESLQPRLVGRFMPAAWKLEPGDWFEFSSDRLQLTSAKFEVVDITKAKDFSVLITARAIDPAFLAFDNDNDPDLSVPPDVAPVSLLLDVPTFTVSATTLTAGGIVEPALAVALTGTMTIAREIVWEYGVWDGSDVTTPTQSDTMHVSQTSTKLRAGVLPSTSYKVRAKARAGLRESPWTAWSSVVTTGASYAVGSAASVPWSGVQTRPANLAALGGSEPIQNALVAQGANAQVDTGFRLTSLYWTTAGFLVSPSASYAADDGLRKATLTTTGSVPNNSSAQLQGSSSNAFPCNAGERIEASVYLGATAWPAAQLYVYWYDTSGTLLSQGYIGQATLSGYDGTGGLSTFTRLGGFATAPANTKSCRFHIRFVNLSGSSVSDAVGIVTLPFLRKADATQTALSPWSPGFEAQIAADVTLSNTAAAVIGQAPAATDNTIQTGATKNTLTYSTSAPGSPTNGDLWADTTTTPVVWKVRASGAWQTVASLGGVFGSTLLETAGGVAATLANFKTLLGTAAGILLQGTQATANAQRGSSYSGTPVEGSWWADTSVTPNVLRFYTGGAWQPVSNISTAISATASPSSINEVHTGSSFSSGTITITPAGGTSYAYAVTFVKSGGAGNVSLSATNSATFTATASLSSGQDVTGAIIVQVFDTSGASCAIRIPLNFTRTD